MKYIAFAFAVTVCFASSASGANSGDCSVRVHVYDTAGQPVEGAPVSLQMDSGGPAMRAVSVHGVAEFCDVGWGEFSVTVGLDLCGQVVVRRLHIRWTQTLDIPVIHQNCHGFTIYSGCLIMLRFSDSEGHVLSGVRVKRGDIAPVISDRYGRAVIAVAFGATAEFQALLPGYDSRTEHVDCERTNIEAERGIILRRSEH